MFSCSIWFSASSFWMGGGLESRCLGRVCDADAPYTRRIYYFLKHYIFLSRRSLLGVYITQNLKNQGKNVNFCKRSQTM